MSVADPPTTPMTGLCDAVCDRKISKSILVAQYNAQNRDVKKPPRDCGSLGGMGLTVRLWVSCCFLNLRLAFLMPPKRLMRALLVFKVSKLPIYRLVGEGSAPAGVGVAEHLAGGTVELFACFGGGD